MSSNDALIKKPCSCGCSTVLVLLVLLQVGCQESHLKKDFPPELISKARSNFDIDITDWDVPIGKPMAKRVRLVVQREGGVDATVQNFCQQKLVKYLNARGFELDPNESAELMVSIVKASEIRKPVRSAKVRIAVKLSANESAEPILLGIADGIVPRPDLSSGVWMPRSSYFRATQYAISKLVHQLDNMPKTTSPKP